VGTSTNRGREKDDPQLVGGAGVMFRNRTCEDAPWRLGAFLRMLLGLDGLSQIGRLQPEPLGLVSSILRSETLHQPQPTEGERRWQSARYEVRT